MHRPASLEICAGGGGQALGIEAAGFDHVALVEYDRHACATLSLNRPKWNVQQADLLAFDASAYAGVELLAGGVPCPPFSIAGRQLGKLDERDLFPAALRVVEQCRPEAVMLENVRGLLDPVFSEYRREIQEFLKNLGYVSGWKLLNACAFDVPQNRPRAILVALRKERSEMFRWPSVSSRPPATIGQTLQDLMSANGWSLAGEWAERAHGIAPTIVGGSKKHGGPDLGPTRAKRAWAALGVDGHGIASSAPSSDFQGDPRLTVSMVARVQGFPDEWRFSGAKTNAYRQVGNAFPPPVARAVGRAILSALKKRSVQVPRRTSANQLSYTQPVQVALF